MTTAHITIDGEEYEYPLMKGSEGERAIDLRTFRKDTGLITYDPGYANTGSCQSEITFIDGDKGILRYRGYPIEELAEHTTFPEVAYLLLSGHLPNREEWLDFQDRLLHRSLIHEDMRKFFEGFPSDAHPMAKLGSMVTSLSTHYSTPSGEEGVELNTIRLLAKLPTLVAWAYKSSIGHPLVYPRSDLTYCANFLNMMFSVPSVPYVVSPVLERALTLLMILHADHEQNCSTSAVRMVGSSQANMFASVGAGIAALWGSLHGGANQRVIEMLETIHRDGGDIGKYIGLAKDRVSPFRLMGFGHRVYKNFDPRATILRKAAEDVLNEMGVKDPLLGLAKELEREALRDPYFVDRKLYPNVDFYSGLIYRAMGIPTRMFPAMFAMGRLPGWMAQWREMRQDLDTRINRPRQVYIGQTLRSVPPMDER